MSETALSPEISNLAERGTWYRGADGEQVFAWLEKVHLPLLGIDAARKLPDGSWVLLVDCLDLSHSTGPDTTTQQGRGFVAERPDADLMFEPVW